jgi:glutamate transport system permease protein
MAGSVLFDAPGPATRARHRLYTVIASVALLAAVAFALWKLYADGQFDYDLWEPFFTPDYIVALLEGTLITVSMAVFAVIGAVVMGLVLGIAKLSEHAVIRWPAWTVVEFFRAMPVLLLMIFLFYTFFISVEYEVLYIEAQSFGGFVSVVIALTLYNGAVLAEVFRAGVNAVPKGQAEAAYAIGMRKTQVMTSVLLPQAVKIMLPAIISQMVVALKDTSLGYAVVAPGLTYVGNQIMTEYFNYVPTVIVITSIYVVLNLILTWLATMAQKRFVGEKKVLEVPMVGDAQVGATGGGVAV